MRASAAHAPDRDAGPGRVFLVALCGGADRPIPALGGRTPFQASATPWLDRLAAEGCSGRVTVIRPDIPPESDSGAMALLGYDPLVYYTGRGPLEGFGMGFWDHGNSVAFRVNFASRDPASGLLDRRTARDLTDGELAALVEEITATVRLDSDVTVHLTGFGRHRGILALSSRDRPLSGNVSNTDPGFTKLGPFGVPVPDHGNAPLAASPLDDSEAAASTARLVNAFVAQSMAVLDASAVNQRRRRLGHKPANILLVRDGGHALPAVPQLASRGGLRVSMYGQVPAERGLARLMGAAFTVAKTAPSQTDTEFYRQLVPQLLRDPADVIFVHLKGPDEPGHDGQVDAKVRAIADIDAAFIGPLHEALGPHDVLAVTCDHATPCELGIHAPDPVPVTVTGAGIAPDRVTRFSEQDAAGGGMPVTRASELLEWLRTAHTEVR
jgi:2,3-bisphosphoglycerate-independent phosphoglycerate mutase